MVTGNTIHMFIGVAILFSVLIPINIYAQLWNDGEPAVKNMSNNLGNFTAIIESCNQKNSQNGEGPLAGKCVSVMNDFNEHMLKFFAEQRSNISEITAGYSPQVESAPQKTVYGDWAEISNMSVVKGPTTSSIFGSESPNYLVGIIKNIGKEPQYKLRLIFSLFDSNNNLIGVESGSPEISNLAVQDSTPYQIKASSNITKLDHYTTQIEVCDKSIYECS